MTNYYADVETTGLNPYIDKIITIQYQKLNDLGNPIGELVILKEWESNEENIVKEFFKVFYLKDKPFNFVPIGQNLLFDFRFLLDRFKKYGLITDDKIDFLFNCPFVDIRNVLIIANSMMFKNTGLNHFTAKKDSGIIIPELYEKKEYSKIEEYIKQETKSFIEAFGNICLYLRELKDILQKNILQKNIICPNCKSRKIIMNKGSTNPIPINENLWGLCADCSYEWDTGEKAK